MPYFQLQTHWKLISFNVFQFKISSFIKEGHFFVEDQLHLFMISSIQLLAKMKISIWPAVMVIIHLFKLADTHFLLPLVKSQNYLLFNMPGPGLVKQQEEDISQNEPVIDHKKKIERIQRCLIDKSFNQNAEKMGSTSLFEIYVMCPDMIARMIVGYHPGKVKQNKMVSSLEHLILKQLNKAQKRFSGVQIQYITSPEQKQKLSKKFQKQKFQQILTPEQESLPRLSTLLTKLTKYKKRSSARLLISQQYCGDGIINQNGTEQCDDSNSINGDGCSNCKLDYCGDGIVGLSQECDDGNQVAGDGCTNCKLDCGNGIIEDQQKCDDGNQVAGDGCTNCKLDCGNGIIEDQQKCDDGNQVAGDGCTNCKLDCGNGIIEDQQKCDDGNQVAGDGCTNCKLDCGNGKVDTYEQCDDGNNISTDGCTDCKLDCGNGIIQSAEQCDDGNRDSGDGCDQYCNNQKKRVLIAVFGTIGGVAVIAVVLGIIFGKFGGLAATGQSANLLQVGGMNNFDVLAEAEARKYII